MLLIGEIGSGKALLINLFCNCDLIENLGDDKFQLSSYNIWEFNDIKLEDLESKNAKRNNRC